MYDQNETCFVAENYDLREEIVNLHLPDRDTKLKDWWKI